MPYVQAKRVPEPANCYLSATDLIDATCRSLNRRDFQSGSLSVHIYLRRKVAHLWCDTRTQTRVTKVVTIDGQPYTASAKSLYKWQTSQLEHEYYLLFDVNDKLRIDFGLSMKGASGSAQQELSEAEINEVRETLLRIVESFRFQ